MRGILIIVLAWVLGGCNTTPFEELTTIEQVVERAVLTPRDVRVNINERNILIEYQTPSLTRGTLLTHESGIVRVACRVAEWHPEYYQDYQVYIPVVDQFGNPSDVVGLQVIFSPETIAAINCDTQMVRLANVADAYVLHRLLQ